MAGSRLMKVKTWNFSSQVENKHLTKLSVVTPRKCLQGQSPFPKLQSFLSKFIQGRSNLKCFPVKLDQPFHLVYVCLD